MEKGARYTVQTRYGWFSLDEGSYRDYLAGKLWINWPPARDKNAPPVQTEAPPDVSEEAVRLRERAEKQGVLETLRTFDATVLPPCKARMKDLAIYEMSLSVRSSNGLMRSGISTFGKLDAVIRGDGLSGIRNIGAKSVQEIRDAFLLECYSRLLSYEKADFWQSVLNQKEGE